jgi:YD repeat-containing protein
MTLEVTSDYVLLSATNELVGLLEPVKEVAEITVTNEVVGVLEPVEEPMGLAVTNELVGVLEVAPEVVAISVETASAAGDPVLGGDLGGVSSDGHVKTVRGVSKTPTYDVQGRLATVTSALGTQTFVYGGDGKLTNVIGTGRYPNKTISYSDGRWAGTAVS